MMIEYIVLSIAATVAYFLGYKTCSRFYSNDVKEFAKRAQLFDEDRQHAFEKLLDAEEKIKSMEENQELIAQELSKNTKKLEAALSANYNFEKSRNEAWDLYRRSSLAAGNAQSMLFREIQKLVSKVNRYRTKLGEDPIREPEDLETMISEFSEKHIEEAKRKAQQL
jgi:hypothetical protein